MVRDRKATSGLVKQQRLFMLCRARQLLELRDDTKQCDALDRDECESGNAPQLEWSSGMALCHARHHRDQQASEETDEHRMRRSTAVDEIAGGGIPGALRLGGTAARLSVSRRRFQICRTLSAADGADSPQSSHCANSLSRMSGITH